MKIIQNKLIQFLIWLLILTPITWLTNDWRVLQVLILSLFFVFGIGFFFLKEYKKYMPFTAAFMLALFIAILVPPALA